MSFLDRLAHGWNAFMNKSPTENLPPTFSPSISYGYRPDRIRLTRGNERSIVTAVLNRIAMDVAAVNIRHVRLDENKRYLEDIDSGLNECLKLDANVDQTGRALIQDIALSMFDEGVVAIVPVDTTDDPVTKGSYDVNTLRTGKILAWYPLHVRVRLYNERKGVHEEVILPKKMVSIVENPLFAVMNEPNSTLQRLIRKMNLLDYIDEQSGAGKLDLIIQLPYVIKSEARRQQAEMRRKDIENQLASSQYGIAYTDGTEHITQLNRSVDNQLLHTIEYLTALLYSQLGITEEIMNGTANAETLNNYYNRVVEPILSSITDEMRRKFLTKTARTQGQSIEFFRDPFKLIPVSNMAEIADKFTRNEIMTSNEIRQVVGMKPAQDPRADELRNKNLSPAKGEEEVNINGEVVEETPQ